MPTSDPGFEIGPLVDAAALVVDPVAAEVHVSAPLKSRVRQVGGELRNDLGRLVLALGGPSPRLRELGRQTDLDKTLIGRVMKVTKAGDAFDALEGIPSPQGLGMFVEAAAGKGVDAEAVQRARATIGRFDSLLREFGSRSDFDTALAGWSPSSRDRRERAARQSAFKASSFLTGCQAEAIVGAHVVQPSADGETCDVIMVRGRYGLRRLRESVPLLIFGTRLYPPGEGSIESIDGAPETVDPSSLLLTRYCSAPIPAMRWLERGQDRLLVLERDEPGVNEAVTVCIGVMGRGLWLRYRDGETTEERHTGLARMPTRMLIEDVILHEDVYPGVEPIVETRLHGLSSPQVRETGELADLDRVDMAVETSWLGIDELATGEAPGYPEMIDEVIERAGWARDRFRVFRQRIAYPVPFVSLTTWFGLPEHESGSH